MNVIFRDWGQRQHMVKNVVNVSVASDQNGVVIETEDPISDYEALKNAGFNLQQEGKLLRVNCNSMFAC